MIFVTVGTHEQPFNRLIKEVDRLIEVGAIKGEVFIQTGYSTYEPKFCQWSNLISFNELNELMKKADVIITHGGPATFMNAIANGKKPIVVPRQKKYGEHVNDHQLDFAKKISEKYDFIELVNDISYLENAIAKLIKFNCSYPSVHNNKKFCSKLNDEIRNLLF